MSQDGRRHEITLRKVVYRAPGMEAATVRRDEAYRAEDGEQLALDVYYPPDSKSGARPGAVVFVIGFPDRGAQLRLGCRAKEMESYVCWARLVAASGMAGVTYSTGGDPAADVHALLRHVRANAASLRVDGDRIALWACSGHVPTALRALMQEPVKCAALWYGYMLDLGGSTAVADAARTFGFRNAAAGKSVTDLPRDTPLFVVRAGRDEMPGLNEAIDRFTATALAGNLPLTLVNQAAAPHAFDIMDDSERSRDVIRQGLSFLRFHLSA